QFVRLWLEQNPDIASAARKLKSASVYPEVSEISFDIGTIYSRISADMSEEQPVKSGQTRKGESASASYYSVSRSRFWGFATTALLSLVVGVGLFVAGNN